jgi:lysophospholipase L1-like esterase
MEHARLRQRPRRRNAHAAATVVALGDSITDGNGSTPGANTRWPDALAERLARAASACSTPASPAAG